MKKIIVVFCLVFAVASPQNSLYAQVNINNIFCLGNGRLAAYEAKADIIQLFGPPYSSPSLVQMKLADAAILVKNKRETGTAIWTHTLIYKGSPIGTITDFVDSQLPCLIRKFDLKRQVAFSVVLNSKVRVIKNTTSYRRDNLRGALLVESPRDNAFYNDYMMPFKQYLQIGGKGNIQIDGSVKDHYVVQCGAGESFLYFVGGPLYPDCVMNSESIFRTPYDSVLTRTRVWWQRFSSRRKDFAMILPADLPERSKLLKTIDAVSVLIKTQQSVEGGVLAGHNYHLAYVRDEYGVSRCLLALGYYSEARHILEYYWKIWRKKGVLHNAQGIGVDAFHLAENEEVEITGYLIIQAFDYLARTKDTAFVKDTFPMLEWAWNSQKKNLFKFMLPFNGDETYVAGGVLPRSALDDGSAEATLLFVTGGEKLIPFAEKNKLWNEGTIVRNKKILKDTAEHYRQNFFKDGRLIANNPARTMGLVLPQFRYGVCEELGKAPGCEFFGWTQKTKNDRYLCPLCFANDSLRSLPKFKPHEYFIHSVSLVPLYIGSHMFTEDEMRQMLDDIVNAYNKTGKIPSRPGGDITVGYDYGLLLYNLAVLNNPAKTEIYRKMMSLLDKTRAWVEYYKNDKPEGTRYRPWESAVNLLAAITYAEKY